jgi:hypothetical protein
MRKILPDDLLQDLDIIVDICIGNERPEDVAYGERSTLPEALNYVQLYPKNIKAVREARGKLKKVITLLEAMDRKIRIMETKIEIKESKRLKSI